MIGAAMMVDGVVEELYRSDWGRIVSTLIAKIGDFELAEDSAQEAFAAALKTWRKEGIPQSPRAWIISTARHKAIDTIRRRERLREILPELVEEPEAEELSDIGDERLRLICTCCHPALAPEAQIALTLRSLGGLTTDEIARAFLVPEPTMAQRLVRAKRKIRDAGIPYVVPDAKDMPERLDAILTVLYLIFNEGYTVTEGDLPMRTDLTAEAIRLARLVRQLMMPAPPSEVTALLALMLLHDSRRETRFSAEGELVLLEDQDRSRWNCDQIEEALPLVEEALRGGPAPYAIQAAIAALHCRAQRAEETDWPQILQLYALLETIQPSPIVALNRAVALAMASGPEAALPILDGLADELGEYHLLHAVRADLLRRLGRTDEATHGYRRALELVSNESERRFLQRRLTEIS
ncbi:RNA polymerase sigma factor [bacterium]|nr:MAG: RNA polymerase sigma factor [bacterium]